MRFEVISGEVVSRILESRHEEVIDQIAQAYLAYHHNNAVNPDSFFLRFEKQPDARIIALTAHLDDQIKLSGIKWISSYPSNLKKDIPRASAVLVLNDFETGYPFALLESSIISAVRTAASAVLAAYHLNGKNKVIDTLGFVGTGLISRFILNYFIRSGWSINRINLYDLSTDYVHAFKRRIVKDYPQFEDASIQSSPSAEALTSECDMIAFATTAGEPYLFDPACFSNNPIVLHVSLRDLAPNIILESHNVVDDVEHCMKANTSLHLTEQKLGHRDFVQGSLAQILDGGEVPSRNKPIVFSPFGMGVLDLALGHFVYQAASSEGDALDVPGFFHEMTRI